MKKEDIVVDGICRIVAAIFDFEVGSGKKFRKAARILSRGCSSPDRYHTVKSRELTTKSVCRRNNLAVNKFCAGNYRDDSESQAFKNPWVAQASRASYEIRKSTALKLKLAARPNQA